MTTAPDAGSGPPPQDTREALADVIHAYRCEGASSCDYQQGDPRVLLLGTEAGGVSLTLDAADDVWITGETWVPDDQEQVEDRAHRTSRTDHQVTVTYIRTDGTIERDLAGDNEWKDETQKRVLDGRRGVEVARRKYNTKVTTKKGSRT
jgi:SNF2 family DNA or RNA helicase